MKDFFMSMLSEDGKISSKRIIAIFGFAILIITMVITTFTPLDKIPDSRLVDSVELIILVALGSSSVEKFKNIGRPRKEEKEIK